MSWHVNSCQQKMDGMLVLGLDMFAKYITDTDNLKYEQRLIKSPREMNKQIDCKAAIASGLRLGRY